MIFNKWLKEKIAQLRAEHTHTISVAHLEPLLEAAYKLGKSNNKVCDWTGTYNKDTDCWVNPCIKEHNLKLPNYCHSCGGKVVTT